MEIRILVVDDDPELRERVAEVLQDAGYAVALAQTGEEALDRVEEASFDLILLDLMMPALGGMEALPLLRKKCARTRVVMITAFSTVEVAVEAMRKGADDYLAKPFKIEDLLLAVRRNIEEARFMACGPVLDMDDTFSCLSNAIRRQILLLCARPEPLKFMDIVRQLGIADHTKVNFHLRILKEAGLMKRDDNKLYHLTAEGRKVLECLREMADRLSDLP